jgi:thiamine-phosphate pyrophosphorylase
VSPPAKIAPILCYVTDRHGLPSDARRHENAETPSDSIRALLGSIARAQNAGVDWIQLREKDLCSRDFSLLARSSMEQNSSSHPVLSQRTRFIVNDRLDVAIAQQAHGIHLGENSLPVHEVRQWLARRAPTAPAAPGPDQKFLLGASCHSLASAKSAAQAGADYIFFGPVFATPSKLAHGPPQGLERLHEVCSSLTIPVLAIGGITVENARSCIAGGAAGIAAIRLFQQNNHLDALVTELRATV